MSNEHKRWLGTEEIAERLGVPLSSVYNGTLRDSMPWVRCGRHLRMRPESFEQWVTTREQTPTRPCKRNSRKKG